MTRQLPAQLQIRARAVAPLLGLIVGADGLFILANILLAQIAAHRGSRINDFVVDIPLLVGLGFIYLSRLLIKRKRNAWLTTLFSYTFIIGLNVANVIHAHHDLTLLSASRLFIVPLAILAALLISRHEFTVRSDFAAFKSSLRFAVIILLVTLAYGVSGFLLLDKSDFHQEITVPGAFQRTIDQFDLTTDRPLHPYTKRARLFDDSLAAVSVMSLVYISISLFQPVRFRLRNQDQARDQLEQLLHDYSTTSEDLFKLWPKDKHYFFATAGQSGTAYRVERGVALNAGDPIGKPAAVSKLLREFQMICYGNDWLPAFIHVEDRFAKQYQAAGYQLQSIGQEAVVNLEHFNGSVANNKFFRNVNNRFIKQNYTAEILRPPHAPAVLERLKLVSDDWLARPGRSERGFVMGYFNEAYMQQCDLLVARDAAGTMQGFINILPTAFLQHEASFDLMRHATTAPNNINDFMLLHLISHVTEQGFSQLNLGLSPLVGLDAKTADNGLIDRVLRFAYLNGDRFYSFSGLYRFKNKYEPRWSERYVAYQGGLSGFTRTMNALLRAMRVP